MLRRAGGGRRRAAGARPARWHPGATAALALFALLWLIGMACALAAAWQAKYHRLAALMLVGGTGLVTCITFLWLSAPDLALTQLMVEVVTTVLFLLGLRWLPMRVPQSRGARRLAPHRRGCAAGATAGGRRRRAGPAWRYAGLHADEPAGARHLRPSSCCARCPRAAAPTS
jgi:uncharacterized MnhB-related membrane protein